jgi:hypothetical protein
MFNFEAVLTYGNKRSPAAATQVNAVICLQEQLIFGWIFLPFKQIGMITDSSERSSESGHPTSLRLKASSQGRSHTKSVMFWIVFSKKHLRTYSRESSEGAEFPGYRDSSCLLINEPTYPFVIGNPYPSQMRCKISVHPKQCCFSDWAMVHDISLTSTSGTNSASRRCAPELTIARFATCETIEGVAT